VESDIRHPMVDQDEGLEDRKLSFL
jgi:hypothetical protein